MLDDETFKIVKFEVEDVLGYMNYLDLFCLKIMNKYSKRLKNKLTTAIEKLEAIHDVLNED